MFFLLLHNGLKYSSDLPTMIIGYFLKSQDAYGVQFADSILINYSHNNLLLLISHWLLMAQEIQKEIVPADKLSETLNGTK